MRHSLKVAIGVVLGSNLLASSTAAQWIYPGGYGGYGMSRWGADPASGYMAGLGSFARGQGVYQLDQAKADAINADTMIKWNNALRARQAVVREEKRREAIKQEAQREARVEQIELRDGTTLNNLLFQILDSDPTAVKSARAKSSISPAAIREIPFEWESEAITACIDQMTANDSLPGPLMSPKYAEERDALHAAVAPALEEDAKGTVSRETSKRINDAVAKFRTTFKMNSADFETGYQDALDYFTTMASLTRLLNDPSMKAFLAKLEDNEERTVGQLVAFMNAHNLRFGRATSDRQIEIYTRLVPALAAIRDDVKSESGSPAAPDRTGEGLRSAAKRAFKGMSWDELDAHSRSQ
jgi:hypothetical protein